MTDRMHATAQTPSRTVKQVNSERMECDIKLEVALSKASGIAFLWSQATLGNAINQEIDGNDPELEGYAAWALKDLLHEARAARERMELLEMERARLAGDNHGE